MFIPATSYSYGDDVPLPAILENGGASAAIGSPRCSARMCIWHSVPVVQSDEHSGHEYERQYPAGKNEIYLLDGNQNMYVSQIIFTSRIRNI